MAALAVGAREVARFAPLSARRPCDLAVASYNLLAPLYVRPVDERTGGVQPFAASLLLALVAREPVRLGEALHLLLGLEGSPFLGRVLRSAHLRRDRQGARGGSR